MFVNNKNFHTDRLTSLSEQSLPHYQIHIIRASKLSTVFGLIVKDTTTKRTSSCRHTSLCQAPYALPATQTLWNNLGRVSHNVPCLLVDDQITSTVYT